MSTRRRRRLDVGLHAVDLSCRCHRLPLAHHRVLVQPAGVCCILQLIGVLISRASSRVCTQCYKSVGEWRGQIRILILQNPKPICTRFQTSHIRPLGSRCAKFGLNRFSRYGFAHARKKTRFRLDFLLTHHFRRNYRSVLGRFWRLMAQTMCFCNHWCLFGSPW